MAERSNVHGMEKASRASRDINMTNDEEFLQGIDYGMATDAALKIQAGFRGHKARQRVKKLKSDPVHKD